MIETARSELCEIDRRADRDGIFTASVARTPPDGRPSGPAEAKP